uniref:Uncharacterized protein n=1 Tax=Aegilops tauschii subsp. strangulata TaxID=200361 RepID=A0A453JBL4_AEGTS
EWFILCNSANCLPYSTTYYVFLLHDIYCDVGGLSGLTSCFVKYMVAG